MPEEVSNHESILDTLKEFVHGGLYEVMKSRGVKMPEWMDDVAGFLHRDDVNSALEIVSRGGVKAPYGKVPFPAEKPLIANYEDKAAYFRDYANWYRRNKSLITKPRQRYSEEEIKALKFGETPQGRTPRAANVARWKRFGTTKALEDPEEIEPKLDLSKSDPLMEQLKKAR